MDPHGSNPVISGLREFYASSPSAREILTRLAGWEDRRVTSVKRVCRQLNRTGAVMDRPEVVQFFERLHAIGLGEFLAGDGDHRPRFLWSYPLTRLSPVAAGEAWELEPLKDPAPEPGNGHEDAEDAEGDLELQPVKASAIKHSYQLREGLSVKFRLPADLTPNEAWRLAEFIKTLPFGP